MQPTEVGVDRGMPFWTPGYAIEEQRLQRFEQPIFADDYYALGSLLLTMIHPIQAMSQLCRDAHQTFLRELERDFGLPPELVSAILALMDPREANRPQPAVIARQLEDVSVIPRHLHDDGLLDDYLESIVRRSGAFIHQSASPDRHDRLFPSSPNMIASSDVVYRALGVAYALYRIEGAIPQPYGDWVFRHGMSADVYSPSLYVGLSGMVWVLSDLGHVDEATEVMQAAERHPLLFEAADVFSGISGFGMACLHLWSSTGDAHYLDRAVWVGEWLLATAQEDQQGGCHWQPSADRKVIGYAHGSSGVALYLLYLHLATGEDRFLARGRQALDYDLRYGIPVSAGRSLSFPQNSAESICYPYWYMGSSGVGTALLRYVAVTADDDLVVTLEKVAPEACRKYTLFPGLFNGLTGVGNFLLDVCQIGGREDLLPRVHDIARGMLLFQIERPSGIAFPGDNLMRISVDYGTGCAGIALFFHRLLRQGANSNFLLDSLLPQHSHDLTDRSAQALTGVA